MFVQRVVVPDSRHESWTVLGEDAAPIEPVERYLAFLTDVARSPNTVKAYAHDLKDWFEFLAARSIDWREVRLEDLGEFVAWLRLPPAGRDGQVAVLPSAGGYCTEATINRKLSAVSAFYQHSARNGVELGDLLRVWQPAGRRSTAWRPFLHHISKSQPAPRAAIRMRAPRKHPRVLNPVQVQAVLDARDRLRDRLLFAVLYDTGMRIGEPLGLRHEDWAAAERQVAVVPRVNDNGARSKSGQPRTIPVSPGLVRLYADTCTVSTATAALGRERFEHPRFVALRSHYRYDAFYCAPGIEGAHEKGEVEGEIGRFRRAHLTPVPHVGSMAALNEALAAADARDDARRIGARAETVGVAAAREQVLLRALPANAFDVSLALSCRVDAKARVCVRQSYYSVPVWCARCFSDCSLKQFYAARWLVRCSVWTSCGSCTRALSEVSVDYRRSRCNKQPLSWRG